MWEHLRSTKRMSSHPRLSWRLVHRFRLVKTRAERRKRSMPSFVCRAQPCDSCCGSGSLHTFVPDKLSFLSAKLNVAPSRPPLWAAPVAWQTRGPRTPPGGLIFASSEVRRLGTSVYKHRTTLEYGDGMAACVYPVIKNMNVINVIKFKRPSKWSVNICFF